MFSGVPRVGGLYPMVAANSKASQTRSGLWYFQIASLDLVLSTPDLGWRNQPTWEFCLRG
jgi:hypothetical protein